MTDKAPVRPDAINVGDLVEVNFNCAKITMMHRAKVLWIPVATGDSWIFECLESGTVAYVSEGCTIMKREVQ